MCDVPSIAVFCSESIECFPGIVSKFFFKLLVTIPVAPIITGTYYYYYYYYYYYSYMAKRPYLDAEGPSDSKEIPRSLDLVLRHVSSH